ncbi:transglycosylase SLT domain-containing protein [Afifella marina]|uniref:Transglycosylase SLT domain-containing protein n=1 Tax=Afifella marina DSM 2698 TaxID=1120955 RepID=A0A1G5MWV9_AFIMA|nr:lytic transglycosylase [Afifella marina DSM 2698]MBK1627845.1 lytic transglycosylase [Afifella marina]MBK5916812.1 lytic transglycosylase [Afifella marina]RAI19863.1 lytic transglycosylase [Afifella marina DSM 2698]SCZ29059.1 Transglycosylase SLT domain-containing protein [Afifella marina DSM 2698]
MASLLRKTALAAACSFSLIAATCGAAGAAATLGDGAGAAGKAAGKVAGGNICEREMAVAAKKYGVPLGVLYAVGLTETGRKGSLQPYAMNIHGRPFFGKSVADALDEFKRSRAAGSKLIDMGCMQINHHFHSEHFASPAEMFNPKKNVDYAARFLTNLRKREGSWTLAVARYHAGPNNNPAQKRYVCAVITNMVATGFGAWTKESREFCG